MSKYSFVFICSIIVLFIVSSCSSISDFDTEKLHGSWKVGKWTIEKTGKTRTNKMDMHFKNDDTYVIDYGSEKEEGKYWISGTFLYTFEKNESEKKVLLLKLTADSLEIQMNRAGEMENVLLIKK